MLSHCAARWGQKSALFKIGKFKHPSLTHRTSQRHQIFRFPKHLGAPVDCRVLLRSLRNWWRYCALNFEKSQKKIKLWGPLTRFRWGNSRICKNHQYFVFYCQTTCCTQNFPTFSSFVCDFIWNMPIFPKNANVFISTIVSPRPIFRDRDLKFKV